MESQAVDARDRASSSTGAVRGALSNVEARNAERAPESRADFRDEVARERSANRKRSEIRGERAESARGADRADRTERSDDGADRSVEERVEERGDDLRDAADGRTTSDVRARSAEPVERSTASASKLRTQSGASAPTSTDLASDAETHVPSPLAPNAATVEAAAPALVSAPSASGLVPSSGGAVSSSGGAGPKSTTAATGPALAGVELAPSVAASAQDPIALARDPAASFAKEAGASPTHPALSAAHASLVNDIAPTAPREPVAPTRLTPAELPQFLETLEVRVDARENVAFVELEPPELGRLTVELSLQAERGVRAEVRAERTVGYAALEARIPELRAALIERGFASADVQLSLGLAQRDPRPGADSAPQRARRDASRHIETERVLAIAPSALGSIDLWA